MKTLRTRNWRWISVRVGVAGAALLALGALLAAPAQAMQLTTPQDTQEYTEFDGVILQVPGSDVRLFSFYREGEATGFNADGTAVAANRDMLYGGTQPRYHLIGFNGELYASLPGGGRSWATDEYVWGVSLLRGNPTECVLFGRCHHGGPMSGTWVDMDPFNWTEGIGLYGTHFHRMETNGVFYGEANVGVFFGQVGGLAYVGDGYAQSLYPPFNGEFKGTEFGTGFFVGTDLSGAVPQGVLMRGLGYEPIPIPKAIDAIDVAVIQDRLMFEKVGAIVIGTRDDSLPGAWEVGRDSMIRPLNLSGRNLEPETTMLYPAKGALFGAGWNYVPKAVSQDGRVIVGTASPVTASSFAGSFAVLWKVDRSPGGRLMVSSAMPIGIPDTYNFQILGLRFGLVMANDVFYDAENGVYVISGRDHLNRISLATIAAADLGL